MVISTSFSYGRKGSDMMNPVFRVPSHEEPQHFPAPVHLDNCPIRVVRSAHPHNDRIRRALPMCYGVQIKGTAPPFVAILRACRSILDLKRLGKPFQLSSEKHQTRWCAVSVGFELIKARGGLKFTISCLDRRTAPSCETSHSARQAIPGPADWSAPQAGGPGLHPETAPPLRSWYVRHLPVPAQFRQRCPTLSGLWP